MSQIFVNTGLGYIGSHTAVELINAGYEPIVIDNLSESPIGAHPTSIFGELKDGEPHHLVHHIIETAIGKRKELKVL